MTAVEVAPYRLLLDGDLVALDRTYPVVNPASGETIGEAPDAGAADAEAAAAAAAAALPAWGRRSPEERAALLRRVAELIDANATELATLAQAETGCLPSLASAMHVAGTASRFRRYAAGALEPVTIPLEPLPAPPTSPGAAGGMIGAMAVRQPVGVVACITPYNAPMANTAGKIAPALAMGNTVVVKPAPQDPLAVLRLAELVAEAGFPPGVVNVVTSSGPATAEALVECEDVDMVSFTGSTAVGTRIAERGGSTMKRLLLELGGKGAAVVFADADLGAAVAGIASTWTFYSGQICTAPTRVLVERGIHDELVERLAAVVAGLTIGDPLDPTTVVGPLISGAQRDRVEAYVRTGVEQGAELAAGGGRPEVTCGFYGAPALLVGVTPEMTVAREEIFGPVVAVLPFDDDDEAVALANGTPYGLFDYVYSGATARAFAVARRLRCGGVGINTIQRNAEAPFGGFKRSGVGRDGGSFGLHAYTELQGIVWPS